MKELKNLLQVKKIIAILLTIVFCVLAINGTVSSEQFMTVFAIIISFYFAQSSVRDSIKENLNNSRESE